MCDIPIIGQTYEIRYLGLYEYDSYSGKGIYTGKSKDIGGICYEFKLEDNTTGFFPIEDVFKIED